MRLKSDYVGDAEFVEGVADWGGVLEMYWHGMDVWCEEREGGREGLGKVKF